MHATGVACDPCQLNLSGGMGKGVGRAVDPFNPYHQR